MKLINKELKPSSGSVNGTELYPNLDDHRVKVIDDEETFVVHANPNLALGMIGSAANNKTARKYAAAAGWIVIN